MSTSVSMLAEIPMFSLLDDDERATLAELMKTESFDSGESIFSVGDSGDSLYIVRRGRVQVFVEDDIGENILTGRVGPRGCLRRDLHVGWRPKNGDSRDG